MHSIGVRIGSEHRSVECPHDHLKFPLNQSLFSISFGIFKLTIVLSKNLTRLKISLLVYCGGVRCYLVYLIADKNFCENDDEIYNHSLRPPPLKPRETQMSDVLQTARKYHARLKSELTKVESFLQMAETFVQGDDA